MAPPLETTSSLDVFGLLAPWPPRRKLGVFVVRAWGRAALTFWTAVCMYGLPVLAVTIAVLPGNLLGRLDAAVASAVPQPDSCRGCLGCLGLLGMFIVGTMVAAIAGVLSFVALVGTTIAAAVPAARTIQDWAHDHYFARVACRFGCP